MSSFDSDLLPLAWSNIDKAGVTLVDDGTALLAVSDGVTGGARSVIGHTAGKFVARCLILNGGGTYEFGIAQAGGTLGAERAAGRVIVERNGDIYTNGVNDDSILTITGKEVDIAVDFDLQTIKFRTQFPGDPVDTFSGGTSFAALSGPIYLYGLTFDGTTHNNTLRRVPDADVPVGFSNWADEESSGEAPSSDALSSDAAASSDKRNRDALSSNDAASSNRDLREAASSDKIIRDGISSEQASSEFMSDLRDKPAPPIQVVVILSS